MNKETHLKRQAERQANRILINRHHTEWKAIYDKQLDNFVKNAKAGCGKDTLFWHNLEHKTYWKCGESDGSNIFSCDKCRINAKEANKK